MKTHLAAAASLTLFALPLPAAASADLAAGQKLHDENCRACHIKRWGGDGSAAYTRPERHIRDLAALRQRVAVCSAQSGAKFFPEDEENVAAYLAQRYYQFK